MPRGVKTPEQQLRHRAGCARGERLPFAKLRPADVRAIREAYEAGASLRELGTEFGVAKSTVHAAVTGATWRHVQ